MTSTQSKVADGAAAGTHAATVTLPSGEYTVKYNAQDLADNAWSDVNFVRPGVLDAVAGANTLVLHDVAGNTTTHEFTLD